MLEPKEKKDGEKSILTAAEKIVEVESKPHITDAISEIVEAMMPEKVEIIPEHRESQTWSYHDYDEATVVGDIVEVIYLKNGVEKAHMTHKVTEDIEDGLEMHPFVQYFPTICAAFPKKLEE